MLNIIEAIHDKNLFLPLFKDLTTWYSWIVALKALFALPLTETDLALYRKCTGRENAPQKPFKEIYLIVGRRGGKSFITAIIAVFLALFKDYTPYLAAGERGVIMIIATDRRQAQIILRYIKGILSIPIFKSYVENEKQEVLELTNGIDIAVHSCSYRAVRGYTIVAAILEESAFWRVEGANPDREIYTALKPAMATIPDSLLISISTPYSRQGVLYESYREYFAKEDEEILVWQASSLLMNPTLSVKLIEREKAKDLSAARAEWDAEFREDLEAFLPLAVIEQVIIPDRIVLPCSERFSYSAFIDPSGGGSDNFTLSIGHKEGEKIIQDALKARRGNVNETVKEYSSFLRGYGIRSVKGDRYAGNWVVEAFEKEGITYRHSDLNKSELYTEALPFINAGMCELVDSRDMVKELRQLERRRGSSGKDTVDHPRGLHDDLANVTCGMLVELGVVSREPGMLGYLRREKEKIEAERKMGEMLAKTERATGELKRGPVVIACNHGDVPTLADLGLSKRESSEAQTNKMGEYLLDMEKNKGGYSSLYAGTTEEPASMPATYKELGIDKKEASEAQILATHSRGRKIRKAKV